MAELFARVPRSPARFLPFLRALLQGPDTRAAAAAGGVAAQPSSFAVSTLPDRRLAFLDASSRELWLAALGSRTQQVSERGGAARFCAGSVCPAYLMRRLGTRERAPRPVVRRRQSP
jgi:hypothetical protein